MTILSDGSGAVNNSIGSPSGITIYDILTGNGIPTFPSATPSNNNVSIAQVIRYIQEVLIGERTDFAHDYTLLGYDNSFYQHIHSPAKCYPSLADGKVVIGGAGAWQLGNFTEIIPANTITTSFDIHYIVFEGASATDTYELVLYSGTVGNEIEIGRIRSDRESAQSGVSNVPIQIPPQLANARISAKVASKSGGGDSVTISVYYHEYN